MSRHLFGIRHHGPGSARSLEKGLRELKPDCILIEGPAETNEVLGFAALPTMIPPVALLIYPPDNPSRSVFYPFAAFSPEWIALRHAFANDIPVRFIDLPVAASFAGRKTKEKRETIDDAELLRLRHDPLLWLAQAAGEDDGEGWWERTIEERPSGFGVFEGIAEAMEAVRGNTPELTSAEERRREDQREAWMRREIRSAEREGHETIAIVCGAWHVPALKPKVSSARKDNEILRSLPRMRLHATWIPWSYRRLARSSGYGAGVEYPGWYEHLWMSDHSPAAAWLTNVAAALRRDGIEVPTSAAIDATRLAEALASMRDLPLVGLRELDDAARSVLCDGDERKMTMVREGLMIGSRIGTVPEETPMTPIETELRREAKRLRLPIDGESREYDLDLRTPFGLARSRLLHRLSILGVDWGIERDVLGKKGTFHEVWRIAWRPELSVRLAEASLMGSTLIDAATRAVIEEAERAASTELSPLPVFASLIDGVVLADLPEAIDHLARAIEREASATSDVSEMMEAVPPLARVARYGDVRSSNRLAVASVVKGLLRRISVGLQSACASLDEGEARGMMDRIDKLHDAIRLMDEDDRREWTGALWRMLARPMSGIQHLSTNNRRARAAPLLLGRACRLLLDSDAIPSGEAQRQMELSLAGLDNTRLAGNWLEGFLSGSGLLLLHDNALWRIVDEWLHTLREEEFIHLLPVLRRIFANYTPAERRQLARKVEKNASESVTESAGVYDVERGDRVLGVVALVAGRG